MALTDVADEEWEKVRALIPPRRGKGRPRADDRRTLNAILLVLQGKVPWNYLPKEYGSDSTANRRLQEWEEQGTWDRIAEALGLVEDLGFGVESNHHDLGSESGAWDGSNGRGPSGRVQFLCPVQPRIMIAPGDASKESNSMRILSCSDGDVCLRRLESSREVKAGEFESLSTQCFLFSGELTGGEGEDSIAAKQQED